MNKTEFVALKAALVATVITVFMTVAAVMNTNAAETVGEEAVIATTTLTAREAECVEMMQRCVGVKESGETFQVYSPEYIAALTAVVEARSLDLASTNNSVRYLDGAGKNVDDLVTEILQILDMKGTGDYERGIASNVLANL